MKTSFQSIHPGKLFWWGIPFLATLTFLSSCKTTQTGLPQALPDRAERMTKAYVFYFDGAGGGTAKNNWAGGVKEGFLAAGYQGAGEMVTWETGEGLLADQTASVAYKRARAVKGTKRIQSYHEEHPNLPVHLLGFSAGTGESIYALEGLPENVQVDRVVLLGTSISRNYDMTKALKRVKDKLYIFTSTHDNMIGLGTKITGTTDRKRHDPSAGIKGFVLPAGANAETRKLYAEKIVTIPYSKEFKEDGDRGGHFDNVKMEFIRDHVAPIFIEYDKAHAAPEDAGTGTP